ncbi:cytidine deaminase [Chitinibacter bivalviorum]|uniref:Cytidine deaminase n=1 Tax=Chitinibacter bivalviorum TaxID=2739434 RepID=A0A7H9BM38_9NEIS|nr:anti-phage dCTP deaminase [Chitinibacter bivalviorum]QLG89151.1 cytidine deaminase [Chitinibacter bivalviorum]
MELVKGVIEEEQIRMKLKKFSPQGPDDTLTEELVIALCAPVGSPLDNVSDTLSKFLAGYGYHKPTKIKISDYIKQECGIEVKNPPTIECKLKLIEAGNKLRQENGHDYLAKKVVSQILRERLINAKKNLRKENPSLTEESLENAEDIEIKDALQAEINRSRRHCYIINSIKNEGELKLLRKVYGDSFFQIGIVCPIEQRKLTLTKNKDDKDLNKIIDIDSGEEINNGQQMHKVFQASDYFIRMETEATLDAKISRFLTLLFEERISTPTVAENAMFAATSAAKNSACMSRQVGAAIADKNGEIISTGWNDVPRRTKSADILNTWDNRCHSHPTGAGFCRNDLHKNMLKDEIEKSIKGWLVSAAAYIDAQDNSGSASVDLINKILANKSITLDKILSKTKVKDLIEFSRAVHAEMHAIIRASGTGRDLQDSVLYCTTYPCHNCAKHIIASGVSEVYYMEPYKKSLAIDLHDDSLVESATEDRKLVALMPYEGVAPSRFYFFFGMKRKRKDSEGKYLKIDEITSAKPKTETNMESIPALETIILKSESRLDFEKSKTWSNDHGKGVSAANS